MSKDYARSSSKTQTRRKSKASEKQAKPWRWFLVGLFSGVFLTAGSYLYFTSDLFHKSKATQVLAKLKAETVTKKPEKKKPVFDYYSMLPEMQVSSDASQHEKSNKTKKIDNHTYMIQAASFAEQKDAERMKAQLILEGFNVSVNSFKKDHKMWYRVMIGPYDTTPEARQIQAQLKKHQIDSLLITL